MTDTGYDDVTRLWWLIRVFVPGDDFPVLRFAIIYLSSTARADALLHRTCHLVDDDD